MTDPPIPDEAVHLAVDARAHALAEPELVIATRWRCPFCRQSRAKRPATRRHMERCWLNPAVCSCKTCANFEPGGDACGCEPGCNWGSPSGPVPDSCSADVDLPSGDGFPVTGCPLWALREAS